MTTMTEAPAESRQAFTILERALCLTMSCHYMGNDRKVNLGTVVHAAVPERDQMEALAIDGRQVRATKKLIDTKELSAVMALFGKAKSALRGLAIPGHRVFGERTYLVPNDHVRETIGTLVTIQREIQAEAAALAARFALAVQDQAEKLGPLFNPADYPPAWEVAGKFRLDWYWTSFQAPDRLESIDHELAMQENAAHEARLSSAFDEARLMVRALALQTMQDLARRLEPGKDGKAKGLRSTALDDLGEFIRRYRTLNMTNDAELDESFERMRAVAEGWSMDQLTGDGFREARAAALEQVRAVVSDLEVLTTAGRGIAFGGISLEG